MADSNTNGVTTDQAPDDLTLETTRQRDAALAEVDRLCRELGAAEDRLTFEREQAAAAKEKAADVLIRYGNRNGWCPEYDDILEEAGIPSRRDRVWIGTVTVRITVDVPVHIPADASVTTEDEAREWAIDHDHIDQAAIAYIRAETYPREVTAVERNG